MEPLVPEPETDRAGAYPLVAIVGPTAAGKSALSLALARRCGGEVLNYDSVQVYRGFDVGSGKLSEADRQGVLHHLVDSVEPDQVFTAGDYRREAVRVLGELRGRGKLPILVGGTGLYLRALLLGLFDGPTRSEALRARLWSLGERRGRGFLHRLLCRLDPVTAGRVSAQDAQKVIRAVEVCILSRLPFSALLERGRRGLEGFRALKIGLNPDRAKLYERINRRVEAMFASGLVEETRALLSRYEAGRVKALQALGYRAACGVVRGEMTPREAARNTQAATRRYAKRQSTWLRGETGVAWFNGFGDDPDIQCRVLGHLEAVLPQSKAESRG